VRARPQMAGRSRRGRRPMATHAGAALRKEGSCWLCAVSGNYQAAAKQFVSDATAAGLYVILDLHWAAIDPDSG